MCPSPLRSGQGVYLHVPSSTFEIALQFIASESVHPGNTQNPASDVAVGSKFKASGYVHPYFDVKRLIGNCENAVLIKKNAEIQITNKANTDLHRFYDGFNLDNMDGRLLPSSRLVSKIDKKKKYSPVIYNEPGLNIKFFASYGDKDKGHKDIYKAVLLANGKWKKTKLGTSINTLYDEEYPFYNPHTKHLYFSSKGHNSIGGFDLFRSKYDALTNSFQTAENLGKGISSPGDDFLIIIDSSNIKAYFASNYKCKYNTVNLYEAKINFIEHSKEVYVNFVDSYKKNNVLKSDFPKKKKRQHL